MTAGGATRTKLSDAQRFDWLRLWRSENIGPRTFWALINRYGSAGAALAALPRLMPRGRPVKIAAIEDIERELEAAARCGAVLVAVGETDYPARLSRIDTAPPLIALRGHVPVLQRPAVAIVGSRNASAAGLAFAERLTRGLAEAGFVIVSGLARGIDLRAHQTSREAGTVAVLAGGHDRIYPAEHQAVLESLLACGAAVSEMPFGWEARGRDFPRRNRIISGLANGVVIVEAARRSGSLITARFAAEQGREVFAVPGSPLDPRAEGTNDLIRNGATLCTSAEDVVEALARQIADRTNLFSDNSAPVPEAPLWDELDLPDVAPAPNGAADAAESGRVVALTGKDHATPQARLMALLGPSPVSIDELARVANLSMRETRAILLELELAGRLARSGGEYVSLVN
ncbi:DNA-processing protein DprA [uncultured Methylovirgula sp.]|uniref:DNA-processing protein DprA n=1 Tax=uncultured Methylovirgula sp. TaxID=1285960 RepID=UPI002606E140|nr:DNA-processing protein DprA [uncultured Methylovirgula sp.]